ncbi:TRIC cation channel family protein [Candidatus Woesearchaeota archaeon]|nr:TRIC cation channel family protein [Candidatus Woesearchaeota archaeon]
MLDVLYLLDIIGTFAFAAFGAHIALYRHFDVFGIFLCAFLTALGGGTLRELILGNIPFYFTNMSYLGAIIIGCAFSITIYHSFEMIKKYMLAIDAVGLATFALIGATKAAEAQLGFFAIIFLATSTAVGGGLIRDIVIREIPQICYKDFYASPAIFLGIVYSFLGEYAQMPFALWSLLIATFLLRMVAIRYDFKLWVPVKAR